MTQREPLPTRREHVLINFTTADGFRYTAGLGYFDDGRLAPPRVALLLPVVPAGSNAPIALQSPLPPVVASVLRCDAPGSNRMTALASADLQREAL
jgi:hypothetical protein